VFRIPRTDTRLLGALRRTVGGALAIVMVAVGIATAVAAEPTEPSDVVVALDFSDSILSDKPNRTRFADALVEIADRVEVTRDDLVNGNAVISLVPFASRAQGYPGCQGLALHQNPAAVDKLADCLRLAARQYRRGPDAQIVGDVGTDTNYVAALREAARNLPADSARPAVVFFTDGKHDVAGVPASEVLPEAQRLFGDRTPFAFLPVGMGLDPKQRSELRSGLEGLAALTRDMTPCPGGEAFQWNSVVFGSAVDAGHAVADALEQVTCSFTVEPSPTPKPTPTPKPENAPGPVDDVQAEAGDGFIDLSWSAPADEGTEPVDGYQARCRADGSADWLPTQELPATEHEAVVDDVDNGTGYACEVAAVSAVGQGPWTPAASSATPAGRPAAPDAVNADRGDRSAVVSVVAGSDGGAPILDYGYECSADGGLTWQPVNEPVSAATSIKITGLTNGTQYTCRATAANAAGVSAASAASNPFVPCGDPFECNPILRWIVGGLVAAAALAAAWYLIAWYRNRLRPYITAYVDDSEAIPLGRGPRTGLAFVGDEIQMDRRGNADVQVQYKGSNRFDVRSAGGLIAAKVGDDVQVIDPDGGSHTLTLQASDRRPVQAGPVVDDDWGSSALPDRPGASTASNDDWD
jgi:hypothetical protein